MADVKVGKVQAFAYTFDELARMVERGNPLALSALIEGKVLFASERVCSLIEKARKRFVRVGRAWILQQP